MIEDDLVLPDGMIAASGGNMMNLDSVHNGFAVNCTSLKNLISIDFKYF